MAGSTIAFTATIKHRQSTQFPEYVRLWASLVLGHDGPEVLEQVQWPQSALAELQHLKLLGKAKMTAQEQLQNGLKYAFLVQIRLAAKMAMAFNNLTLHTKAGKSKKFNTTVPHKRTISNKPAKSLHSRASVACLGRLSTKTFLAEAIAEGTMPPTARRKMGRVGDRLQGILIHFVASQKKCLLFKPAPKSLVQRFRGPGAGSNLLHTSPFLSP